MGKVTKHHFMPSEKETLTEDQRQALIDNENERTEKSRQEAEARDEAKKSVDFMTGVTFEPFEDRVLVYPDPVLEKTQSGIYVPESATQKLKPLIGTVVKVGPGKMNRNGVLDSIPVKPGLKIAYGNYAGTPITLNGIEYLIMRYADCFGKV